MTVIRKILWNYKIKNTLQTINGLVQTNKNYNTKMVAYTLMNKMKKRTGFTLLECLVVLSIWSLLLLLTVPLFFKHINHIQEKQFFQTFKNDVLYTQSLAISSYKNPVRINIKKNQYEILKGRDNEVLSVQEIPPDWDINRSEERRVGKECRSWR